MQKHPDGYIITTNIGETYYLTEIWNNRPTISKTKAIAEIFPTLKEATDVKVRCERYSGFAYYIEEFFDEF